MKNYILIWGQKKKNLLLIVSKKSVIHYKYTEENTNEDNFLKFIEEVSNILDKIK